jgi:hypothetical protein
LVIQIYRTINGLYYDILSKIGTKTASAAVGQVDGWGQARSEITRAGR